MITKGAFQWNSNVIYSAVKAVTDSFFLKNVLYIKQSSHVLICVSIYMYIYVHIYIHIYTHTNAYKHTDIYTHAHIRTHSADIYVRYTYKNMCKSVHVYA